MNEPFSMLEGNSCITDPTVIGMVLGISLSFWAARGDVTCQPQAASNQQLHSNPVKVIVWLSHHVGFYQDSLISGSAGRCACDFSN